MAINLELLQPILTAVRSLGTGMVRGKIERAAGDIKVVEYNSKGRFTFVGTDPDGRDVIVVDLMMIPNRFPLMSLAWVVEDLRGTDLFKEMVRIIVKRTGVCATPKVEAFLQLPEFNVTEETVLWRGTMETVVVRRLR